MSKSSPSPRDYVVRIALVHSNSSSSKEVSPSVWRLTRLSSHLKLDVLHDKILAPLLGWTRNYHTYMFQNETTMWLCENTSAPDLMHASLDESSVQDPANGATLGDLLPNVRDTAIYTYDLGDCWYHKIELKEIKSENESNGACVVMDGAMRCPDEDGDGCATYQKNVLDHVLTIKANPHDDATARILGKNCFDRRNASNVRGRFDPSEFSVEQAQAAVHKALKSRASAMTGTKQFSSSQSMIGSMMGSFCPTVAGQRVLKCQFEYDRGGDDFHLTMSETVNLKPDDKSHTACVCGNPIQLSICGGCTTVYYCSTECQRKDWKHGGHKKVCKREKANKKMCDEESKDWANKKPDTLDIQGEQIPLVKFREKLRFQVGDAVECAIGDKVYAKGVIVATHYREPHWPSSKPSAPYQIELANDQVDAFRAAGMPSGMMKERKLIYAVWDDDHQIRKLPKGAKVSPRLAKVKMDIVD